MWETATQAIVEASSLPMSILIVGVGDADFSAMEVRVEPWNRCVSVVRRGSLAVRRAWDNWGP